MQVHVWDGLREGLWDGLREGLLDGHRVYALYCGSERGSTKFLWEAEGALYWSPGLGSELCIVTPRGALGGLSGRRLWKVALGGFFPEGGSVLVMTLLYCF